LLCEHLFNHYLLETFNLRASCTYYLIQKLNEGDLSEVVNAQALYLRLNQFRLVCKTNPSFDSLLSDIRSLFEHFQTLMVQDPDDIKVITTIVNILTELKSILFDEFRLSEGEVDPITLNLTKGHFFRSCTLTQKIVTDLQFKIIKEIANNQKTPNTQEPDEHLSNGTSIRAFFHSAKELNAMIDDTLNQPGKLQENPFERSDKNIMQDFNRLKEGDKISRNTRKELLTIDTTNKNKGTSNKTRKRKSQAKKKKNKGKAKKSTKSKKTTSLKDSPSQTLLEELKSLIDFDETQPKSFNPSSLNIQPLQPNANRNGKEITLKRDMRQIMPDEFYPFDPVAIQNKILNGDLKPILNEGLGLSMSETSLAQSDCKNSPAHKVNLEQAYLFKLQGHTLAYLLKFNLTSKPQRNQSENTVLEYLNDTLPPRINDLFLSIVIYLNHKIKSTEGNNNQNSRSTTTQSLQDHEKRLIQVACLFSQLPKTADDYYNIFLILLRTYTNSIDQYFLSNDTITFDDILQELNQYKNKNNQTLSSQQKNVLSWLIEQLSKQACAIYNNEINFFKGHFHHKKTSITEHVLQQIKNDNDTQPFDSILWDSFLKESSSIYSNVKSCLDIYYFFKDTIVSFQSSKSINQFKTPPFLSLEDDHNLLFKLEREAAKVMEDFKDRKSTVISATRVYFTLSQKNSRNNPPPFEDFFYRPPYSWAHHSADIPLLKPCPQTNESLSQKNCKEETSTEKEDNTSKNLFSTFMSQTTLLPETINSLKDVKQRKDAIRKIDNDFSQLRNFLLLQSVAAEHSNVSVHTFNACIEAYNNLRTLAITTLLKTTVEESTESVTNVFMSTCRIRLNMIRPMDPDALIDSWVQLTTSTASYISQTKNYKIGLTAQMVKNLSIILNSATQHLTGLDSHPNPSCETVLNHSKRQNNSHLLAYHYTFLYPLGRVIAAINEMLSDVRESFTSQYSRQFQTNDLASDHTSQFFYETTELLKIIYTQIELLIRENLEIPDDHFSKVFIGFIFGVFVKSNVLYKTLNQFHKSKTMLSHATADSQRETSIGSKLRTNHKTAESILTEINPILRTLFEKNAAKLKKYFGRPTIPDKETLMTVIYNGNYTQESNDNDLNETLQWIENGIEPKTTGKHTNNKGSKTTKQSKKKNSRPSNKTARSNIEKKPDKTSPPKIKTKEPSKPKIQTKVEPKPPESKSTKKNPPKSRKKAKPAPKVTSVLSNSNFFGQPKKKPPSRPKQQVKPKTPEIQRLIENGELAKSLQHLSNLNPKRFGPNFIANQKKQLFEKISEGFFKRQPKWNQKIYDFFLENHPLLQDSTNVNYSDYFKAFDLLTKCHKLNFLGLIYGGGGGRDNFFKYPLNDVDIHILRLPPDDAIQIHKHEEDDESFVAKQFATLVDELVNESHCNSAFSSSHFSGNYSWQKRNLNLKEPTEGPLNIDIGLKNTDVPVNYENHKNLIKELTKKTDLIINSGVMLPCGKVYSDYPDYDSNLRNKIAKFCNPKDVEVSNHIAIMKLLRFIQRYDLTLYDEQFFHQQRGMTICASPEQQTAEIRRQFTKGNAKNAFLCWVNTEFLNVYYPKLLAAIKLHPPPYHNPILERLGNRLNGLDNEARQQGQIKKTYNGVFLKNKKSNTIHFKDFFLTFLSIICSEELLCTKPHSFQEEIEAIVTRDIERFKIDDKKKAILLSLTKQQLALFQPQVAQTTPYGSTSFWDNSDPSTASAQPYYYPQQPERIEGPEEPLIPAVQNLFKNYRSNNSS